MSTRALVVTVELCFVVLYSFIANSVVLVKCENSGILVSSYAKVSRSGSLSENEGRSNRDGVQQFWTKR